jgi:hypothetical protein
MTIPPHSGKRMSDHEVIGAFAADIIFAEGPHAGKRLGLLSDAELAEVRTWLQGCVRGCQYIQASRALKIPVDSELEFPRVFTDLEEPS